MAENTLDDRIEQVILDAMAETQRMTSEMQAIRIRRRLQAAGLCSTVRRGNEPIDEHPMALRPLDPQ